MKKRSGWLKNTLGAIIMISVLVTLVGCGGGATGVSSLGGSSGGGTGGTGGGGTGGGGTGASLTSATLTWDAPALNVDGTTVTDLAGYKLYYGEASGSYNPPTDLGNVTTSTVEGLTPGTTYYFSITAYDSSGNESALSPEVSITI